METLIVIPKLLEKIAVLVATVLLLVMIRPAGVWLTETGHRASYRRRAYLTLLLGSLAIWGSFLGIPASGVQFNVRMVGVMVGGFLGGRSVGILVGTIAGIFYALHEGGPLTAYTFSAGVMAGLLAGMWSKRFGTNVMSIAAGSVVVQVTYHLVLVGFMAPLNPPIFAEQFQNWGLHAVKIGANMFGAILFMGVLNLARELERAHESARASKDEARRAKLEALQYQVRPHFLFNILNTLSYLIRTDPERARELTLDLSTFLRYTLSKEDQVTTLREEIEQIKKYVDLERARFGSGLVFEVGDLPEEALGMPVPPLILQPLVENAIRHGAIDGEITISLNGQETEDSVHLIVGDNGSGFASLPPRRSGDGGLGIDNVRERLSRFYSGRSELKVENVKPGGAQITIVVHQQRSARRKILDEARRRLEEAVA